MMRDFMVRYLKNLNESNEEKVTRLYFDNNGKREYVDDFSPFANPRYMSKRLLEALKNKTDLTYDQERELETFIVEKEYDQSGFLYDYLFSLERRINELESKTSK